MLGLGESLKLYEGGYDFTVGVNDIWREVHTDAVVCVDEGHRFTAERLKTIYASRPLYFYSQLEEWAGMQGYKKIELQEAFPDYVCQLHIPKVPKSLCSPFVAAAIAYKYHGATEIHLYGVDLLTHPLLKHSQCATILKHFRNLKTALTQHGCRLLVHGNGLLKSL